MKDSTPKTTAPRDEVDELLDEIDAGSMRMARLMTARFGDATHHTDLAPPHYMLLRALRDTGSMRASDVAETCSMKNSAVSMALQVLEERGYIAREHDDGDRRVVHVCLTAAGLGQLTTAETQRREMMRRFTADLTTEDLRALVRIQNTLIDTVARQDD